MADVIQHIVSRRHADAPALRRVTLDAAQRAELIRKAEHWLSAIEDPAGQARLVLNLGRDGSVSIRGGGGER